MFYKNSALNLNVQPHRQKVNLNVQPHRQKVNLNVQPHRQKVKTVLVIDKIIQQNKHTQKKVSFVMSAQKLQEPVTSINTTS